MSLATDLCYWTRSLSVPPLARETCERALAVVVAAQAVVNAPRGESPGTCCVPVGYFRALEAALAPASQPEAT